MPRRRSAPNIGPIVDRLVESRYEAAIDAVAELQAAHPTANSARIADLLIRRATRELAAVAAFSGGAAASPGIGTAASALTAGADLAWTLSRLGEMVMAIGAAYGHDASSIEQRRAWVMSVLTVADGAASGVEGVAARLGARGGLAAVQRMAGTDLSAVNAGLGAKVTGRIVTEQVAARAGRLVPFGIGAGIGAAGNMLITRSVGRAAKDYFGASRDPSASSASGARFDGSAINATATEVTATEVTATERSGSPGPPVDPPTLLPPPTPPRR